MDKKTKRRSRRPNGSGTVYCLKGYRSRPWTARVAEYDNEGRRIWKTLGYFATKTEAEKALVVNEFRPLSSRSNITFEELYAEWSPGHFKRIESHSQAVYRAAYKHCKPLYNKKVIDIRTAHMQAIIDALAPFKSNSTLNSIKTLLGLLYKYALENDIVLKNYASFIKLPKAGKTERERFSDNEISVYEKDGSTAAQILLMLIYSGMRIQELLNLKVSDVDLRGRVITGGLKTEAGKNRKIPIHDKTYSLWENWVERAGEGFIFVRDDGKLYSQREYRSDMLYPTQKRLGLPRRTPHAARHTCASLLARQGVAPIMIQQILGHSNYAVTADTYTHLDTETLREALNKI